MNKKSLIKSFAGFSAISWIQALVGFMTIPLTTRLFSTEEWGMVGMFNNAVSILVILATLSMEQSYIRFFSEQKSEDELVSLRSRCVFVSAAAFTLVFSFIMIFGKQLSYLLFSTHIPVVIYVCLPVVVLCSVIHCYQHAYFRMQESIKWYTLCGLGSLFALKISILFAALIFPTFKFSAIVMAACYVLSNIIFSLLKRDSVKLTRPKGKEGYAPLLKYALPWIPSSLMAHLNVAIVSYVVKDSLSFSSLGIYNNAISVSNVLAVIQSGFAIYWPAFMYKNYETEKPTIKKIHSVVTFGMAVVCIGVMIMAKLLFMIVGKDFREGVIVLGLLLFSPFLNMVGETTVYGIYLEKKTHLLIYLTGASLAVSCALAFLLVPRFGLIGAASANALSALVFFILRTVVGQKYYKSTEKLYRTVVSACLVLGAGVVCYFLNHREALRLLILGCFLIVLMLMYLPEIKFVINGARAFVSSRKNKKQ